MWGYIASGSILLIATLVTKIIDYLEESDIRRVQGQIRFAQIEYCEIGGENRNIIRSQRRVRRDLEYIRRGALIKYHERRMKFLRSIGDDLHLAKESGFDQIYALQTRVPHLPGWKKIEEKTTSAYFLSIDGIHGSIHRLKALEQIIREEQSSSKFKLNMLKDGSTHGRLGAKKAIEEYLDERNQRAKNFYRRRSTAGLLLPFQGTELVLECRCRNSACKAYIAPEMQYCMVCGQDQQQGIMIAKQKIIEFGIACDYCGITIDETLPHCFNCGAENDPFGLIAAYKSSPP